jgi:hypothetical protein
MFSAQSSNPFGLKTKDGKCYSPNPNFKTAITPDRFFYAEPSPEGDTLYCYNPSKGVTETVHKF